MIGITNCGEEESEDESSDVLKYVDSFVPRHHDEVDEVVASRFIEVRYDNTRLGKGYNSFHL